MSEVSRIAIKAFVSEDEGAPVEQAAQLLSRALTESSDLKWICEVQLSSQRDELLRDDTSQIILTSLLPELASLTEPWPLQEQRLKTHYLSLAARNIPVFVCTILRCVASTDREAWRVQLERIRRLDLFATEISRETGAYVIDVDRALADIGAQRLGTDHRLSGKLAIEIVAHFMACTLLDNGLDAAIPFEIQEPARKLLESWRPPTAHVGAGQPEVTLRKNLMAMGQGRQRQTVAPVAFTVQDNYAGWLVRQVLRGAIGPGEVMQRLVAAVKRRGVRESAALLGTGISRQVKRRK